MQAPPKISVVMPCFNHGEFLPEAVASVTSAQRNDLELIVIDDGSTDERTRKELDSLEAGGIHVIRQENKGPSAARNAAILASKGEYILPLDADDRLRPGFLDTAIGILDSQPKVGIVYGDAERFGLRIERYVPGPFDTDRLLYWNFIPVSAVYRRSVWEQNGGYDNAVRPEDYDFWLCALEHGWQFAYVPEVLFENRVLENSRMMSTYGRLSQLSASISKKHGPLYRSAWVERQSQHDSGKATLSNLSRLIKLRLTQKFRPNGGQEWICPQDPVPSYGQPPRASVATGKIVFIAANEFHPWGGSEVLWGAAAERLAQRGIQVTISAKDWGKPVKQIEHLRSIGCRVFLRPAPGLARRAIRKLPPWRDYHRRHLAKIAQKSDLIVISQAMNSDGLPWMEAAHASGLPYASISQTAAESWWPDDVLAERLAHAYESATVAYFVSEANLELSRRQSGTPLRNARIVRNPFNVRYNARPEWPSSDSGEFSLACVARLDCVQKAQDILLQVLSLPHWRERNIGVSLVGKGANERSLRRLVASLGLSTIQFYGFADDIEKTWATHHALILPSRHEGLPLALVEAMLCARPAIATDVGGVRELLRDNVNGFLVKAPTVELLDEAMNRAWENRHRLREMGEQAALDVRKFVGPDPVEDFVRDLLTLIESPQTASEKPTPQ